MTANNNSQQQPAPLNRLEATEMAKAIQRIRQLTGSTASTPENVAQIETDTAFLVKNFLAHAGEFVTYFFVVADEYEVLLRAFHIVNRRLGINNADEQIIETNIQRQ